MSLLTFARENPNDKVQVADEITAINRLLERKYSDCTCYIVRTGDFGKASQWVTVELEVTHDSLDCLDWYTKQAKARGLVLSDWQARQVEALESDLTLAFLSPERA
jgi:hypothetical protein